jgi:hypothetical protein
MDKPLIMTSSILEHLEGLPTKVKKYYVAECLGFEQKIIKSILNYKKGDA